MMVWEFEHKLDFNSNSPEKNELKYRDNVFKVTVN